MNQYIYGVDVGGTFIKIGLFSKQCNILIDKKEIPTPKNNHKKSIFAAILSEIKAFNTKHDICMDNILGIGLAIPCPTKNGYVSQCANLDFCEFDLVENFKKILPKHLIVKVGNDASLATLGESKSLDKTYESIVMFTLGTGVGGGIILNSKIIEGKTGLGGEIGHIKVYETNETCGCGAHGCLEQICGTKGILSFAKKQKQELGSILEEHFTVKDVFDAAKNNDQASINTVNRVAKYLASAAVNLAITIEPEIFILGGGISKAGNYFLDKIKEYYQANARFNTGDIPFILASTGNDAGMIGAFYYVSEYLT